MPSFILFVYCKPQNESANTENAGYEHNLPRSCVAPSDTVMMNGMPQQAMCNTGTSNFATVGHLEKAITNR